MVAERLARVHVRQVDLDGGQRHRASASAIATDVCVYAAGLMMMASRALARRLDAIDELAFDVGLVALDGGAALRGALVERASISASVVAP